MNTTCWANNPLTALSSSIWGNAISEAWEISSSNVWVISITVLWFVLFIGLLWMVYKAFNKKG